MALAVELTSGATGGFLGKGGFGVVRRGVLKESGKPIAVKELDLAALQRRDATSEESLLREVAVMELLEHAHIIKMFGWVREGDTLKLYLELLEGPELKAVLEARGALAEEEARHVMLQLTDALLYLHAKEVIHRDVKAENIMLLQALPQGIPLTSCHIKLLDFGLSRLLDNSKRPKPRRQPTIKRLASLGSSKRLSGMLSIRRSNSTPRSSEADLAASAPTAEVSLSELSISEVSISEKAAAPAIKHQVSLVGTRGYAPPEIVHGATPGAERSKATMDFAQATLIDAFAAGKLLRYMLTGVSPEMSIMQALEAQGPCGCLGGGGPRIVEPQQLSAGARAVMQGLTKPKAEERLSLQEARTRIGAESWCYMTSIRDQMRAEMTTSGAITVLGSSPTALHF